MGIVLCPKHGRSGFVFVCPEVAEAVEDKMPCRGIQRLVHYAGDDPELIQACWFCPACITRHKLPPSGPVADPEEFLNTHSALYRPMCPRCFEEWRLLNDSEIPVHWRFASGQAFAGLRELVRSFDFLRLADGHTYAGIEHAYLVQVIDGFLGEPDDVVFGGDRANLNEPAQGPGGANPAGVSTRA